MLSTDAEGEETARGSAVEQAVNNQMRIRGTDNVYFIGDIVSTESDKWGREELFYVDLSNI